MPEFKIVTVYYYYNNTTYFVLSITGILVAVCSKEGVDNLPTNDTLIALQQIINEDDMPLEVLGFNKEHLGRVNPYFTEEIYSHLQRQGYIEFSVRSAVMFM